MLSKKWRRGHSRGNNVSKGPEVGTPWVHEEQWSRLFKRGAMWGRVELYFSCQGGLGLPGDQMPDWGVWQNSSHWELLRFSFSKGTNLLRWIWLHIQRLVKGIGNEDEQGAITIQGWEAKDCCGLNYAPPTPTSPKSICWSHIPSVTMFGDRAVREVIKVKWGHNGEH